MEQKKPGATAPETIVAQPIERRQDWHAPAQAAGAPVGEFDGYIDGVTPRVKWYGAMPAVGAKLYLAQSAPCSAAPAVDAAELDDQITDTASARAFVRDWHLKHFPTDRTFSRYIMNDPERSNPLAGDFAWQLAKALAAAPHLAALVAQQAARIAELEQDLKDSHNQLEVAAQAVRGADERIDQIADVFGIGSEARKNFSTVLANVQNSSRWGRRDGLILDWLESKSVNVRDPLRYGSRDIFWASPTDDDGEIDPSDLRKQVLAIIETERQARIAATTKEGK